MEIGHTIPSSSWCCSIAAGGGPPDPDPVAPHRDDLLAAVGVEADRVQLLAVFRAQPEDVPDLDPAGDAQLRPHRGQGSPSRTMRRSAYASG
jgi:hypothetical protein